MPLLFLLTALHLLPALSIHTPFGYQSPSSTNDDGESSSFVGSIHYDPLHHALYLTGTTYGTTFDGVDAFNLQHEQSGWDIADNRYTPKNGDCFYGVYKLPVDRPSWEFDPASSLQSGVTLMHSRRFGSKTSSEGCSAVDILPTLVEEEGLGGYIHEFESLEHYNDYPPTVSPKPSSSTYYPTYLPSVTARPTAVRGAVPEDVGTVTVDPDSVVDPISERKPDMTISNIATKVKLYHEANPSGIISLKEVRVYDASGINVAEGKTATQSSDYSSNHAASNAVDGDIDTFSHTAAIGNYEWWQVDLGEAVSVSQIAVVNRECKNSNCLERLSYATMELMDENDNVVARRNFGDTSNSTILEFTFEMPTEPTGPSPTYSPTYLPSVTARPTPEPPSHLVSDISLSRLAQKVRIQLPSSSGSTQLGLREVQIFDENNINVAFNKPASQSSDWNANFIASNAVDGNVDTASDTFNEVSPWWEVDLQQTILLSSITITNRWCREDSAYDKCLGRMSYAIVSLVDENGDVVATRNVGDTVGRESIELDFLEGDFNEVESSMPPAGDFIVTSNPPAGDLTVTSNPPAGDLTVTSNPPVTSPDLTISTPTQSDPTYSPSYLPSKQPSTSVEDTSTAADTWMAQKVRIELIGEVTGLLSINEVEVIASGLNKAFGKEADQSTSTEGFPAGNAVDSDRMTFSLTDGDDANPWWEVNLAEMTAIDEIVIYPNLDYLNEFSFAIVSLLDDQGTSVAELDVGDVTGKESISLVPPSAAFDFASIADLPPRKLEVNEVSKPRELFVAGGKLPIRPATSSMETRSVRLLVAGHVESVNFNDGYIVEKLTDGQYDQANVYGFTQQMDIRLPLGPADEPSFLNDFEIMNNPNANINGLEYSLEEESLGGFVTSGVDAKALLNDHLPVTLNTLYPVALVADSSSKKHYYVMLLASDNAELNDEGKDDSLHQDNTIGSGANQQSWTDYDNFGVPGVISPGDLFGKKGRPKFGSDYRIVLKKMAIDSVDPSCVLEADSLETECPHLSSIEKTLSSTSYNRDTIVMSQSWVQEFLPDLGEDTRPAGLIFAPSNDANSPDLLVMGGSTSGNGAAFGTTNDSTQNTEKMDLDGFVTKIRTDNGSFAGKDAFDASTNSFTNTHSMRISSLPNKHDVVASLCSDPLREWGTPEPQDHVYVVGSTEGLLPGLTSGLRDETFVGQYPEETAVNSMEAFLMKVDLATMNPVWTTQIAGINLVSNLKGNAYGFGCAVTHDSTDIFLTGMVKDGGVVTDFSADSLKRHDNAARGGTDVFVASYKTSDGSLNFLRQIGSTKDDTPSRGNGGITVDRIGNPIIVGNTRGSLMRQRDVSEYMFGHGSDTAPSDIFIMSLERDTGEYAPISDDTMAPVIPIDNNGLTETSEVEETSASKEEASATETGSSPASIFLFVILVLFLAGAVMGSAIFIYKTRKVEQQKARELHGNFNLSPHGRRSRTWGLQGKPGGGVLNQFEDMNIMVEVRNSASGGWHGIYDDEAIQQIDFGTSRGGYHDDVIEQSLFMEDGLQALEEIEKSVHNNYSIGDDDDEEEVTDEDLIQAYNEAMAIDIEPESEAVAALTRGLNMPNLGSDHHEIT